MKNMKLRVFVFLAACTLSMASLATVHVACKSGQKPGPKGGAACVATSPAKSTAKTSTKARAPAKASSKSKSKSKVVSKTRGRNTALARADAQPASELPTSPAIVDCDSTQTVLQGGAPSCPAMALPHGAGAPAQAQANPGTSCFAALAASYAARRLSTKVPFLSDSAAGPEALANKGVPTRMEKEELGSVMAGYGMCLDMAANWRRETYAPVVVNALDAYWHEVQAILKELAAGKHNYGDAARAVAESDKNYRAQLGAMAKDLQPGVSR